MASPSTETRAVIKALVEAEFAAEGFKVTNDRIHASLGHDRTRLGCFPGRETTFAANQLVLETEVVFQFYGKYNKDVDPEQKVDPAQVEGYAERFRQALENGNSPGTRAVWYFTVQEIAYPPDPTGNMTRFEARVLARGENSNLVESTG